MGLTKGLRRLLVEDDRNRVAEAIREHLQFAGWRVEPGPSIGGHSQLSGPADNCDGARRLSTTAVSDPKAGPGASSHCKP
jgi:hypothetical protein